MKTAQQLLPHTGGALKVTIPEHSETPYKQRILLVDDHVILLEGLQDLISRQPDLVCAGTASTCDDALNLLRTSRPDLLVVDISLPDRSGLELINDALSLHSDLPILVLSMHDEGLYAQRALKAGARGYLMKSTDGVTFLWAIRAVLNGSRYLSPSMSAVLLDALSGKPVRKVVHGIEGLTEREFQVFQQFGEGKTTQAVAEALKLSPKTVEVHRSNIRHRLGLKNGGEVIRYAVRWVESQKLGIRS